MRGVRLDLVAFGPDAGLDDFDRFRDRLADVRPGPLGPVIPVPVFLPGQAVTLCVRLAANVLQVVLAFGTARLFRPRLADGFLLLVELFVEGAGGGPPDVVRGVAGDNLLAPAANGPQDTGHLSPFGAVS